MSRIRVPKTFLELIREVKPETFSLMGKYQITDSQGRYLHWDEFKWRVEKGDDEVAAWTVTKLARKGIAKNLVTLQAEGDRYFSYCVPNSLSAKLHSIDRMTGGGRKISDGLLISTDEKNKYLVKSLMMEEAITSAQLEGASTTREIAKEMLQTNPERKYLLLV